VALARERVPEAAFLEGDAQALPFAEASFDALVCGYGIIHCPDPEKALAEMARVLRPGGRAALSVWAAPGPDNGFGLFLGALKAHGRLDVGLPDGPDFFQFSEPERLEGALEAAGLTRTGAREVPQTWRLARTQEMIPAFLEGTVRTRALYSGQTEAAQAAIGKAVEEGLARFQARPGGYEVPMPALVGWGSR
jgi:SAM-dependent methyltransferase